jgi:hypothetical protein
VAVVEDTRGEGCWSTYRRALELAGASPHHLMLQDDLGLLDFLRSVAAVIRARPHNLIALYTNSKVVTAVRERGESWLERPGVTGPAVIWPSDLIGEFLDWQDNHIDNRFEFDTVRTSMWLIKTGKRAFATVPSLTEHLGCVSSTLGLNDTNKVATWYLGDDRSAVDVDWSRGLAAPLTDVANVRPEWWAHCHD